MVEAGKRKEGPSGELATELVSQVATPLGLELFNDLSGDLTVLLFALSNIGRREITIQKTSVLGVVWTINQGWDPHVLRVWVNRDDGFRREGFVVLISSALIIKTSNHPETLPEGVPNRRGQFPHLVKFLKVSTNRLVATVVEVHDGARIGNVGGNF